MSVIDEYRLAVERQEEESNRYWSRTNVMLLVQGALITLFATMIDKEAYVSALIPVQGFFFSAIWLATLAKGKHYISRWDKVIKKIEANSPTITHKLCDMYEEARKNEKRRRFWLSRWRTTELMEFGVVSTGIFWLIAFALSVYTLFTLEDSTDHRTKGSVYLYLSQQILPGKAVGPSMISKNAFSYRRKGEER